MVCLSFTLCSPTLASGDRFVTRVRSKTISWIPQLLSKRVKTKYQHGKYVKCILGYS